MSDAFEFARSTAVQSLEADTPYVSKKWNYISDINQGVYGSSGLSLVQFDMSSIFNSSNLIDPAQMFLSIPISYVASYVNTTMNGALVGAVASTSQSLRSGSWATVGLKQGFFQLIHGADLQVDGKTIEQFQPYANALINFKLLSSMSQDDYQAYGETLGMGQVLDNPNSMRYCNTNSGVTAGAYGVTSLAQGPQGGQGMQNNAPFGAPTGVNPDFGDQTAYGPQCTSAYNKGLFSRLNRIVDTTVPGAFVASTTPMGVSGLYAPPSYGGLAITTATQCQTENRGYYSIDTTGTYMIWNDIAIIRLCDVFDSLANFPLMKKMNGLLRLYINTGVVGAQMSPGVVLGGANYPSPTLFSLSSSTFTNTCPLVISNLSLPASPASGGLVAGLFIGRATNTNIFGVNLGASNAQNPQNSCRLFFPQVELKAQIMDRYISENRSKKIVWRANLFNQFSNITTGSSFSGLVQSGVSNIAGVLILPFLSASTNGLLTTPAITGITAFSQLLSPFDMAPSQSAPISLINLQVSVGGQNIIQNTLYSTFENFIEQVSLFDKVNAGSPKFGLSCGLISQYMWEQSRMYYVDCSRGQNADLMTPRNVNISFTNNSQQTIDCLIFTLYQDSCIVDTELGSISGR